MAGAVRAAPVRAKAPSEKGRPVGADFVSENRRDRRDRAVLAREGAACHVAEKGGAGEVEKVGKRGRCAGKDGHGGGKGTDECGKRGSMGAGKKQGEGADALHRAGRRAEKVNGAEGMKKGGNLMQIPAGCNAVRAGGPETPTYRP